MMRRRCSSWLTCGQAGGRRWSRAICSTIRLAARIPRSCSGEGRTRAGRLPAPTLHSFALKTRRSSASVIRGGETVTSPPVTRRGLVCSAQRYHFSRLPTIFSGNPEPSSRPLPGHLRLPARWCKTRDSPEQSMRSIYSSHGTALRPEDFFSLPVLPDAILWRACERCTARGLSHLL